MNLALCVAQAEKASSRSALHNSNQCWCSIKTKQSVSPEGEDVHAADHYPPPPPPPKALGKHEQRPQYSMEKSRSGLSVAHQKHKLLVTEIMQRGEK